MNIFQRIKHSGYQRGNMPRCLCYIPTRSPCFRLLGLVEVNTFAFLFIIKTIRKRISRELSQHADEGNYPSLSSKPHQHTETKAFCGSGKLYFTCYLARYTVLKIAVLWKLNSLTAISTALKTLLNTIKSNFANFYQALLCPKLLGSIQNYVNRKINAKHPLSNQKNGGIFPEIKEKALSASSFSFLPPPPTLSL